MNKITVLVSFKHDPSIIYSFDEDHKWEYFGHIDQGKDKGNSVVRFTMFEGENVDDFFEGGKVLVIVDGEGFKVID